MHSMFSTLFMLSKSFHYEIGRRLRLRVTKTGAIDHD